MAMSILTCENHPELRWSTKDIAISGIRYNGSRTLFFIGVPSGKGMYQDKSGLDCVFVKDGKIYHECSCRTEYLILAPENKLVDRG